MKILCLVKFTPDIEDMQYDCVNQTLARENVKQIINPEDACALGFALKMKKKMPDIFIEAVSMAPAGAKPLMEDILRRNADKGVLITDPAFAGSDTLATSTILASYLKTTGFDVILTGDHSIDGDTAHVPSQIAGLLGTDQISGVTSIDEESFLKGKPVMEVENDMYIDTYQAEFPLVISISRSSRIRLPFVRYADLDKDVSEALEIISNKELSLQPELTGVSGSATRVVKTWPAAYENKEEQLFVKADDEGVEKVYGFLLSNGYLR